MRISDWSSDVCSSDLQHIGWDGEKAALRKADTEKPARRVMVGRLFKRPVVKASQHRRWRYLQFQGHATHCLGPFRIFLSICPTVPFRVGNFYTLLSDRLVKPVGCSGLYPRNLMFLIC